MLMTVLALLLTGLFISNYISIDEAFVELSKIKEDS